MTTMARAKEKTRKLFESPGSGFVSNEGLARLQVVPQENNPLLWKLLKRMGEKGPAPMLVNTSFNTRSEPMVCTPRDAVECFWASPLDALVIGSFLLEKPQDSL